MYNLELIGLVLGVFGSLWLLLIIMFSILGGRILIQLKNPITKEFENITDVTINHKHKGT